MGKQTNNSSKKRWFKRWLGRYKWFIIASFVVLILLIVSLWLNSCYSFGLSGVTFSEKNGFYNEDLEIEIKPDGIFLMSDYDIKYNFNGDDLNNTSENYYERIKLETPESGYELYTITAFACKKNGECTKPQVATYVLGKELDKDVTIDIANINCSQKSLYDYYSGIMVGGMTYDLNIATYGEGYIAGNYNNRGKEWARDAYFTMFDHNGGQIWDQDASIEISGGSSSSFEVKSMIVKMSKKGNGGKEELEEFRLRSGSQDQFAGNIRSSVANRLIDESGYKGGAGTKRVVVFLNGEYYGIFDMQQNYSKEYLMKKFGLEKKKYIEKYKSTENYVFDKLGVQSQIWDDLDSYEGREQLERLIDMDDYLMYYAIQILMNNTDWPKNNFEGWKYRLTENTENKYEDGRIRFLIYDTDLIYYSEDGIEFFNGSIGDIFVFLMENTNNGQGSSFRKVMSSSYYRQKFIELLRVLLSGPFSTENVLKVIDEEAGKIDHQMELFYSDEEYDKWKKDVELLKTTASNRENDIKREIEKYFNVNI